MRTLKLLGMVHIPDLNIFESAVCSQKEMEANTMRAERNLETALYRLQKNVEKSKIKGASNSTGANLKRRKLNSKM